MLLTYKLLISQSRHLQRQPCTSTAHLHARALMGQDQSALFVRREQSLWLGSQQAAGRRRPEGACELAQELFPGLCEMPARFYQKLPPSASGTLGQIKGEMVVGSQGGMWTENGMRRDCRARG